MDILLNDQNKERIKQKVEAGLYSSPNDALEKALELLDEHDTDLASELADLRAKIHEGVAQGMNGEYTRYDDEGLQQLKERIKQEGRERRAAREY